jgi:hypothetical protein
MRRLSIAIATSAFFFTPMLALAAASVTATPPYPGAVVNAGTRVSFSVIPSGFSNPTFSVIDSFGGGANTSNIDSTGSFFWNTNLSEVGTHNITINVSDSSGNSGSITQSITVNSAPTASIQAGGPSFVTVGYPVSFTISPQGFYTPSYSTVDSFSGSSLRTSAVSANGTFSWTPLQQDIGVHTITVTVKDTLGYSATTMETLTVLPIPGMTINNLTPGYTLKAGQTLSFTATTTGLINPTYVITDAFNNTATTTAHIDATGHASWTPQPNDVGVHAFTLTATDSNGRSLAASVSITVQPGAYVAPTTAVVTSSTTTPTITATVQPIKLATVTANTGFVFTKYLQIGSSGAEVTALQNALTAAGSYSGPVTGYFGALTMRAVQIYQTAHGVAAVGVVGPATRAVLNKH